MSQLRIELFGKFCARCSDQVVEGLEASKVQELLCYILLNRARPHARETLAGVLWGETSTSQSRKYLRQALWQLQTALERHANIIGDRLLLLEPNWIHLNADCSLSLDVDEFERACTFVQGIGGAQLDCDQAERLRQAALLYKGDLLEGWYQDWCWFERERFQNMYLTLLDKLTAYCEAHNDYEAGLDYGTRILQFDRARERTHQQLIRLYMLSGDRAAALRQFERCATALQAELGVEPSKYTLALHAQIQSDSLDLTALPSGTLEPDVVKRLENVWKVLADMQAYLRKETLAIEQLLNGHRADS